MLSINNKTLCLKEVPEYDKYKNFKDVYMDLGITISLEVHILTEHVTEFCKNCNNSLGLYSEQALESSHYDFLKNCWEETGLQMTLRTPSVCSKMKSSYHLI